MTTVNFRIHLDSDVDTWSIPMSAVTRDPVAGVTVVDGDSELTVVVDSVAMARELASAFAHVGDELEGDWPQSGRSCGHLHCADREGHIDECLGDDAT